MKTYFLIATLFNTAAFAASECKITISLGCEQQKYRAGKYEIPNSNDAHDSLKQCFRLAKQIKNECTPQYPNEPMVSSKFFSNGNLLGQRRFEVEIPEDINADIGKKEFWIKKVLDRSVPAGEVRVDPAKDAPGPRISKAIFGSNILYFYKKTNLLNVNHPFQEFIEDADIKSLRYPGGTVANNYDWKKNRLDNPNVFPGETSEELVSRPDYKKFLEFRDRVNGEANFVINITGPYHSDLRERNGRAPTKQEYINRAVEWVCAVNGGPACERKGFRKQYTGTKKVLNWEIGNEHYLDGLRHKMTVDDYARDLILYAKAMKEVAPDIRIGAVGPFGTTGRESIGARDWELGRQVAWWPRLGEIAGSQIDFLVTHRYDPTRYRNWETPLAISSTLEAIRSSFLAKTNKKFIPLAMTEYNLATNDEYYNQLSLDKVALAQVEQLFELMQARVFLANFWPTLGFTPIAISHLVYKDDVLKANAGYDSFKAIAHSLRRYLVPLEIRSAENTNLLDAFISKNKDKKHFSVVFLNRSAKKLKINLNDFLGASVGESRQLYSVRDELKEQRLSVVSNRNSMQFEAHPLSVNVVELDYED